MRSLLDAARAERIRRRSELWVQRFEAQRRRRRQKEAWSAYFASLADDESRAAAALASQRRLKA